MQSLKAVVFTPHPPVLIPEIGNGGEAGAAATSRGLAKIAHIVGGIRPEVLVYVSPHGNMFADALCILAEPVLKGDMRRFGAPEIRFEKKTCVPLLRAMTEDFGQAGVPFVQLDQENAKKLHVSVQLDHGAIVPMYFIDKAFPDYEMLHITPGAISLAEMYMAGKTAARSIARAGLPTVVVASGDLSHYLKEDGPYGYRREGELLDEEIVRVFKEENLSELLHIGRPLIERGGECGLKGFAFAAGMVDGLHVSVSVYSYEGPFGVGYMTASALPTGGTQPAYTVRKKRYADPYLRLAQAAIEKYAKDNERLDWDDYKRACDESFVREAEGARAGVFVSIHKEHALRGCIGTISPTCEHIAGEIVYCAVEACSDDPRFFPVTPAELPFLDIKVDILQPPEDVPDKSHLDPGRYGVIVSKGMRRGLLLPNLEGVDSVDEQVRIAKDKAGIPEYEDDIRLKRFEVVRHQEG